MFPRRCDRYLVREAGGPFFLALAGLTLFILLNIILALSYLMVDRGIGLTTFLRLVLLRVPAVLVLAIPMAALFATFLGLGRMEHDREVMAFESVGLSLRRILFPLVLAAVVVGGLDFVLYNWGVPASEHAYQQTFRGILFTQAAPRITANEFFKGPQDQFFYIRRYNAADKTMRDVFIYDITGKLFPQAETQVTILTAQEGRWVDPTWELSSGRVYGFDLDGVLIYSGRFEHLSIPMERNIEQILAHSKTPSEMGIGELLSRIGDARRSGQRTNEYVVELHLKISLPLATVVFVLLGGALSLIFGSRSRAVGIIVSLVLVGIFQGFLFLTQTFGQRGAMHPALAAWLPDLVFGAIGLALFCGIDRLASRNLWNSLWRRLPFLALSLILVTFPVHSDEVPLDLRSDELLISEDEAEIRATGSVVLSLERVTLCAESLVLQQTAPGRWSLEASGDAVLTIEEELTLAGERLQAEIEVTDTGARTVSLEGETFRGQSRFINSLGEEHVLFFRGEKAHVTFDELGEPILIEARRGELTTCDCCGLPFQSQPYTLHASRVLLYPERLLVVFGLTARAAGVSAFWLPVYVQPLKESLESPLFPAIGRSNLRGWFLKWSLPYYLSERLYGSLLFDYYHKFTEIGGGLVLRYDLDRHRGKAYVYSFPAKVGDSLGRIALEHTLAFTDVWKGTASLDYQAEGGLHELAFSARFTGSTGPWNVSIAAAREWEEEEEVDIVTERLPELSLFRDPLRVGAFSLAPSFSLSWAREWQDGILTAKAVRLSGEVDAELDAFDWVGFTIVPALVVSANRYLSLDEERTLSAVSVSLSASRNGLTLDYAGSFVTGASPFDFDQIDAEQYVGWRLVRSTDVRLTLSGGVDLSIPEFDPLTARLTWRDWASWCLEVEVDLETAWPSELSLTGKWDGGDRKVTWDIPYDPALGEFEEITLTLATTGERARASLSASIDDGLLASLKGTVAVQATTGWGASFSVEYDADTPTWLLDPRYRLFREIGGCIQIGVERASRETWLYASILAFPEAILRYAPASATIDVGD